MAAASRSASPHPRRRTSAPRRAPKIGTRVILPRTLPPPPPGYRLGYYDGYVVAYDPTTQIVADVLDLVNAAVNR